MDFLKQLEWRYATKKFDSKQKLKDEDLDYIKKAIQLSPSSYGLQMYKVISVEQAVVRKKLRAASYDQPQVTDAANLFVFCRYGHVMPEHIDQYMSIKAASHSIPIESTSAYSNQIKASLIEKLSPEQQDIWTAKQVYIALSNALSACAFLQIDAAPMEGFNAEAYDNLLGLTEKGLKSTVILAMGYRSPDDATQHLPKVRRPLEMLFEQI